MRSHYRGLAVLALTLLLCGCGALDARRPVGVQVASLSADLPAVSVRVDGQEVVVTSRTHQPTLAYQQASIELQLNPGLHRVEVIADGVSLLSHSQTFVEGRHASLQLLGRTGAAAAGQSLAWLVAQRVSDPDGDHAGLRFTHALVGYDPVSVEVEPAGSAAQTVSASLAYGAVSSNDPLLVPRGAVRLRVRHGETLLWDQAYQLAAGTVYNFALSGASLAPTVVSWSGA